MSPAALLPYTCNTIFGHKASRTYSLQYPESTADGSSSTWSKGGYLSNSFVYIIRVSECCFLKTNF